MDGQEDFDWLGRNGGWVLLVLGVAVVAVSVAIADQQAVASVLAFTGVAAAVFGVLLSRLEGAFEFSPTKFAATLRAARNVGTREDLTLEERADLILRLLGVGGDARAEPPSVSLELLEEDIPHARLPNADTDRDSLALPRPVPFTVTGATEDIHRVAVAFEQHVARVFRSAGWEIEDVSPAIGSGFDFVARQREWTLYIEIKLRRRLSTADAREFMGAVLSRDDLPRTRYVLAVNSGALSAAAREALAGVPSIDVWEVPVEGW